MSDIADDMVNGACCSHCGVYFPDDHLYPVLCWTCYDSETDGCPSEEERAGLQRALWKDGPPEGKTPEEEARQRAKRWDAVKRWRDEEPMY